MEQINLNNLNQASKGTPDYSSSMSERSDRQQAIKAQIVLFYLSSRRNLPESEALEAEVNLAMTDWEEIPSEHLLAVCAQARKSSGAFLASNGSVVAIWRENQAELRRPKSKPFKAIPKPEATPEEIDTTAKYLRELGQSISRGVNISNWKAG